MEELTTDEENVKVFGANVTGFHGAGGAGNAFMGIKSKPWRSNAEFQMALKALNAKKNGAPYNPTDLLGKYAILGQVHFMRGLLGYSYGLVTTQAPGKQGFVDSEYLLKELKKFFNCAANKPTLTFKCGNFGLKRPLGFSWWSKEEMNELWLQASEGKPPSNVIPPKYIVTSEAATKPTSNITPTFDDFF